jgi:putative aldouronate transport system permease protein
MIRHKWLYLMVLPGVLYMLIFNYLPMAGIIMAFQDYKLRIRGHSGVFASFIYSEFIGFDNFIEFFTSKTINFWSLLRNTLSISLLSLALYFPAPIILSLMLNELRSMSFKRVTQTLIYIPHFVSLVIVASITQQLFNTSDGIIYEIFKALMGSKAPSVLTEPGWFAPLIVGQSIWKETGYGTIIFLAALSGVDMQLYEAARIDGAGRWKLMWHITLPSIRGTIVIMLIMKCGSILNTGFEQIYLMKNAINSSRSQVFDTYIYERGIQNGQYSLSAAAGLFKSVVSLIMVLGANKIAKLCGESGFY